MTDAEELKPAPAFRFSGFVLSVIILACAIGSWYVTLDVVARGEGRLTVASRTQSVSREIRGRLAEVYVREGDDVVAGQTLAELDASEAEGQVKRLTEDVAQLEKKLSRLEELKRAIQLVQISVSLTDIEAFLEIDRKSGGPVPLSEFGSDVNIDALLDSLRVKRAEADILEAEIGLSGIAKNIASEKLDIAQKESSRAKTLIRRKLISASKYEEIISKKQVAQQEVDAANIQLELINRKRRLIGRQITALVSEEIMKNHEKIESVISDLRLAKTNLLSAKVQLRSHSITSPVNGTVNSVNFSTIGSLVEAGEEVMTIVPRSKEIRMEAKFSSKDIGFIEEGQKALLTIDSFPPERFGFFEGSVSVVGSDSVEEVSSDGKVWMYPVIVKVGDYDRIRAGRRILLSSGMSGRVDIVTGDRRLASYFFDPVVQALQTALRER